MDISSNDNGVIPVSSSNSLLAQVKGSSPFSAEPPAVASNIPPKFGAL